ncbi:MAG: amidohydrolase [Gemmatimonadales bacterium]|nr:MAG: amidohydrolase [Gemmatimonadales bacterium]
MNVNVRSLSMPLSLCGRRSPARSTAFTLAAALLFLPGLVSPSAVEAQSPLEAPLLAAADLSDGVRNFVAVDAAVVALVGVTVVDGTGAEPAMNRTVLVRNGMIAAVGAAGEVEIPEGAEVLELAGHTVIPGIVGMHNHTFYTTSSRRAQLDVSSPRLYLASGVTTIRTTGSYHPYSEVNLKRAIEAGDAVGPRMHVTGPYLTGPTASYMTGIGTPEEARRVVGYWADEGATWFKFYTRVDRASFQAAVEEAHRRGLRFTGHLCSVSFTEAVEFGIDNLEHGFFTNTDWDPAKEPDECPAGALGRLADVDIESAEVTATLQAMVAAGVPMTSTLAVYELGLPNRPPVEDRFREMLAPEFLADYLATRRQIDERGAEGNAWAAIWDKALAFERRFHEMGGILAAGVDPTGIGGALPGFGDQRNYELLLEVGLSPVDAIRVMTLNGAAVLGEDHAYGSVEVGKRADLVVIAGDPVADPASIRNVHMVFRDGVGYDPERLLASVRGQVGVR